MYKSLIVAILFFTDCSKKPILDPHIIVLGTTQDGGAPQAGCKKTCCINRWANPKKEFYVTSIGIVDPNTKEAWMIEATPDFPRQLKKLTDENEIKGIFITHAHIGHYSGLMYLGRETMGYKNMPLFLGPRMSDFIATNAPWSQLVELKNVKINQLKEDKEIVLNSRITIKPFTVPHRDEFSETHGFEIRGPNKSLIFIPDIDKWEKWNVDVLKIIKKSQCYLQGIY